MTTTVSPPAPAPNAAATAPRLDSVDLLRGAVMVLMVLDHTRDFFTDASDPTANLAAASSPLFLTRWVTHFCAPVFAFLAGTGGYLAGVRGLGRGALARFLVTRGLWLIVLEQTVEPFGLAFRPTIGLFLALVLWSIGWGLVTLGTLVALGLPSRWVGLAGLLMIATHNLADGITPAAAGALQPLLVILHQPGLVGRLPGGPVMFVGYPLVPWVGVVMAGYGFGELLGWEPGRRRRAVLVLGLGLTAAFVALRWTNAYGDPRPWSDQGDPFRTLLSFVNCTKYPPSLLFLLMTLGPALVALAAFDAGLGGPLRGPLVTLGRVPLLYYLLQWYVIHTLALLVAAVRGQPLGWLFPAFPPVSPPPGSRYSLPFVYAMWAVVVVLLYFPCRWFAGVRRRNPGVRWLRYL